MLIENWFYSHKVWNLLHFRSDLLHFSSFPCFLFTLCSVEKIVKTQNQLTRCCWQIYHSFMFFSSSTLKRICHLSWGICFSKNLYYPRYNNLEHFFLELWVVPFFCYLGNLWLNSVLMFSFLLLLGCVCTQYNTGQLVTKILFSLDSHTALFYCFCL